MGANNSNSSQNQQVLANYGGIYFKPSKDRYHPGDQFEGIIYLNLLTSYPGNSLYVRIKGVEKYLRSYVTHSRRHTHHHLARDKLLFLNIMIPVYKNSGGEFQPGQYAFPISFLIPSKIPSSFYQEGIQWVGSIEFKVKAILGTFDPKAPKLKYKENILIEEHRKLQAVPLQKQENIPLTTFCCFGAGNTTITLGLEKDALMPGETTNLIFSVDNSQGKVSFIRTRCELIEEIVLGAGRFVLRHHVVAYDLPGFQAKQSLPQKKVRITLPPYNPKNPKYKRIPYKHYTFHDIHNMRYAKNDLVPTAIGKMVDAKFFLAVELIYDGCDCCFRNPMVYIPVQIYIPSFNLPPSNIKAPPNWHPKMMPTANLTLQTDPPTNSFGGGNHNDKQQQPQNNKLISMQMKDNFMQPQQNFMQPQQSFNANTFAGQKY